MRIVVIGGGGQLGTDLVTALAGHEVNALGHADIELTIAAEVREVLQQRAPDLVINLAAFHRVDDCEENPMKAFAVNAAAVHNLARTCQELGASLLHISTDYVFDGKKEFPYEEFDSANPLNVYGVSKLAGEIAIKNVLHKYYIVRTSGLYGVAGSSGKGGNFVELMLRLARDGKPIRVVADQVLSPTYTVDLSKKLVELIGTKEYGTYHITNSGSCSWHEFAKYIIERIGLRADLTPTTTAAFCAKAKRPAYSVLENGSTQRIGLKRLRPWQEAIEAYLLSRKEG